MHAQTSEQHESLWVLTAPPAIWAAHFLLSYWTAAIWCAKFAGPDRSLASARVAIAVYTSAALLAIALLAARGYRRHKPLTRGEAEWPGTAPSTVEQEPSPHHADTAEGRYRFVGLATLLLSGLTAIAIIYAALAAAFIGSCY